MTSISTLYTNKTNKNMQISQTAMTQLNIFFLKNEDALNQSSLLKRATTV